MGKLWTDTYQSLIPICHDRREAHAVAFILMEQMLGLSQTDVLTGKDDAISGQQKETIYLLTARLQEGEPIQYVVGHTTFCGLQINLTPSVLIPRPETEELVLSIHSSTLHSQSPIFNILDIGTGSGCIALALKHLMPDAHVVGIDISADALEVAKDNARCLNLDVDFRQEDIMNATPVAGTYQLIVSNPPYITDSEAADMDVNVKSYEPHIALFVPDYDPLRFYRPIIRYASVALTPQGTLAFEVNRLYANHVAQAMEALGFVNIEIKPDQYGNQRFVIGRRN